MQPNDAVKIAECVTIDYPPEPMDGTPATVQLGSNGKIAAMGKINYPEASEIRVRGRVNSGPIVEGFLTDDQGWEVPEVVADSQADVNQLWIEIRFTIDGSHYVAESTRAFFVAALGNTVSVDRTLNNYFSLTRTKMAKQSPVRLAIATPMFRVGGVERWVSSLAKWLDPDRARVVKVIVTNLGAVDAVAVSWLPRWVELLESAEIHDDQSFDVLATEGLPDLVERITHVAKPTIDLQHGVSMSDNWRVSLIEAAIAAHNKLGTRIVGVNSLVRENFPDYMKRSITIIENGSDPAHSIPLVDRRTLMATLGLDEHAKVALYIGRIAEDKNVQSLVDAVSVLGTQWHAVIVGPQFAPLERVGPRVHLIRPRSHIGNWIGIADVLCHPSDHESHCFAINDAWFAKLPVVSCDYPVNQRFHDLHGDLMWIVPIRPSPEVLASAIQEAHSNRNDLRIMRAWEIAHREYSAPIMGRRWTDFLCSLAPRPVQNKSNDEHVP